jgi:hypothetical protein
MSEDEVRAKCLAEMEKLWPVAKGSVREVKKKCNRKGCKLCASGQCHTAWLMTFYQDGKQSSRHVPTPMLATVKTALENGRKLEALMVQTGLDLLKAAKEK